MAYRANRGVVPRIEARWIPVAWLFQGQVVCHVRTSFEVATAFKQTAVRSAKIEPTMAQMPASAGNEAMTPMNHAWFP